MYLTNWAQIKKDGSLRRGEYVTKQKTQYHEDLHKTCDFASSGPVQGILHFVDKETKSPAYVAHMAARTAQRIAKQKARERLEGTAGDMLEALKMLMTDPGKGELMMATLERVQDAIAKAKGEK